ncbi:type II toxin-antitoxin system RelE family toxin [Rubrolithibacter danxiaensis]|uniref:type II toxin-antitoxin system RelE family toxin n=1 Tax=Rubrolithibacter danxiaensis TaxID=3390805 RepID=UPI003BF79225
MKLYHIRIKKAAFKELEKVPVPYNKKIIEAIDKLASDPRPDGVKKLKGENAYRIRVSDYRVIYVIEDVIQIIEVHRIRHRKDAYL